jgi:hypothetical protein
MKNLSIIKILVLTAGLAGGVSASDLPDCPTDGGVRWHNCIGTATFADGNKYVGEYKDNKFDGQGTATFADGNKYVGEWKDDKRNGQGTYTSTDRTIREGIWEDGEFLGTVAEVERAERTRIAAEEKAERIYNACLLDKGADVDMSVSSLESALKATCRSIAEDPSFLEGLRYD